MIIIVLLILLVLLFGAPAVLIGGAGVAAGGTYMLFNMPMHYWLIGIAMGLTPMVLRWLGAWATSWRIAQERRERQAEREAFWGPRHPSWDAPVQPSGRKVRREPHL